MVSGEVICPTAIFRNSVGDVEKHDYVILNTVIPTHLCLTGHASWNLLDLTLVSKLLASHCSSTVTNDLLGSDHTNSYGN